MSILQTTELKKYYGTEPNITRALDGVNLSVEQGEFVAIVGTSGSGKSTLLNMIGGLDVPTSGKVIVDGRDLSTLKDEQLTIFRRRKIGFIFQNYNLVPVLNVFENIVLPVELDGNKVDKKFMKEVVRMLGLEDKLNNMPSNLSGGQQQRVAIARALVSKPAIVLADEPTGNLDSMTSSDVLSLLKVTSTKFHQTLVMITHNNEIAQLADRIIRISNHSSFFLLCRLSLPLPSQNPAATSAHPEKAFFPPAWVPPWVPSFSSLPPSWVCSLQRTSQHTAWEQTSPHPHGLPWHQGHGNNLPPTDSTYHPAHRSHMSAVRDQGGFRLLLVHPAHNPMPFG